MRGTAVTPPFGPPFEGSSVDRRFADRARVPLQRLGRSCGRPAAHYQPDRVPALTLTRRGGPVHPITDLALIQRFAESGKLRVIAVTGSRRAPAAPDVPTVSESGLKGYVIEPWFGVVAPAGVPQDIVSRLNGAIVESLKAADVVQRLAALGYEPIGGTADDFARTI